MVWSEYGDDTVHIWVIGKVKLVFSEDVWWQVSSSYKVVFSREMLGADLGCSQRDQDSRTETINWKVIHRPSRWYINANDGCPKLLQRVYHVNKRLEHLTSETRAKDSVHHEEVSVVDELYLHRQVGQKRDVEFLALGREGLAQRTARPLWVVDGWLKFLSSILWRMHRETEICGIS